MRITVLRGGPSTEREISLIGGAAVAGALREAGHDVFESDVSPADLSGLDRPADVVFPVLHGEFGESGHLQAILEGRNLRFVGSGAAASRVGMDKVATKRAWEAAGLPTPAYRVVTPDNDMAVIDFPAACVVKAVAGGSSIGVHVFPDSTARIGEVRKAVREIVGEDGRALVEQCITGTELTVGILDDRSLPPIRIAPKAGGFFDFAAKYSSGGAEHRFDLNLPESVAAGVAELCLKAHRVIGCRDLSRVDVMVDAEHRPFLLEINTLPGFTPRSLLPEAAGKTGISFVQLCDRLAKTAAGRA